jgi:pimeloyl-ACP methyl ester carboxylesterase
MLAHDTRVGKSPTLVFIHGWTCDRTAMEPVAAAFPEYAQINLDLLGHGASPKSIDYSITAQACAVLDITPKGAILIGHSMGAQVAIDAAVQASEKIAAVILLDPAQIIPIEKSRLFGLGLRDHLYAKNTLEVLRAFAGSGAVKVADKTRWEQHLHTMLKTDPEVIRQSWDGVITWSGAEQLAKITCPTLVIAVDKPVNRLVDLAKANKHVMTAQVAGSGHSLQFEVMPQVEAMIRRFLELKLPTIL